MEVKEELMIDVDHFIGAHINDALSIASICSDDGLSRDDARLFTYIHVKCKNSPAGVLCSNGEHEEEISALEIMLGLKDFPSLNGKSSFTQKVIKAFSNDISREIKNIDFAAQEGCGIELYLHSELLHRLRFHTDETFRNEMLNIYKEKILPKIKIYTMKKVFEAFKKQRAEAEVYQLKQRDLFN